MMTTMEASVHKSLKTVFGKTLYERRWSIIIWFVAVFLSTFLTMLLFPSLRDSLGASLQDVPESMRDLLGSAEDYQTVTGFADLQIIAQMVFLTIIMGVIVGTSLLAGEESSGTLQALLAQPVRRSRVYMQKFWALCVMTFITCSGLFGGVLIGVVVLGESINAWRLFLATLMIWLLTLFFATMAYGIGAATGKRGLAGILTGFYAFVSYMLTALAGISPALEKLNYGSPFYYFNTPSVLKYGLDFGNIAVLLSGTMIFFMIGIFWFTRRDISQH